MFTMAKIKDGSTYLDSHLTANDYYAEKETVTGHWVGRGSERLGLRGDIHAGDTAFEALRRNRMPDGSGKLTARDGGDRIRFLDFQCSAPKSVSVMAVTLGDVRLLQAHDESATVAFRELETFAASQKNTALERHHTLTGNVAAATFRHTASRALDPQVHTHFVTTNATWDASTGTWKALTEFEMVRAIRYGGKVYQNELVHRCRELGYALTKARDEKGAITGFELAGVPLNVMERFSKRRADIEAGIAAFERKHGRSPTPREIHVITKETRDPKLREITTPEVIAKQRAQLSPSELNHLDALKLSAERLPSPVVGIAREQECLRMAVGHLFERRSVAVGHEIAAEALNQGMGHLDLTRLQSALRGLRLVRLDEVPGPMLAGSFATERGLRLEKWAVGFVNDGIGLFGPLAQEVQLSAFLSAEQRDALSHVLASRDRAVCLRGAAGVGKTTVLKELDRVLAAAGRSCLYCAPTASAADTLRKEGLDRATTLADLLVNVVPNQPERLKGAVLVVDEAGLASNRQGVELLRASSLHEARVVFVGDSRQHTAVEAGDFLRMLETHSKMFRAEIVSVRRQTVEAYREAVQLMARGSVQRGIERLGEMGWIKEGKANYLEAAAADFLHLYGNGKKPGRVLAVTPSWEENHTLTEAIRKGLKEKGILGTSQTIPVHESLQWTAAQKTASSNYLSGMVVTFNRSAGGFRKGESAEVVRVGEAVMVRTAQGVEQSLSAAPGCFDVARVKSIEVSVGDRLLLRANDRPQRLINGDVVTVSKVDSERIHAKDGRIIDLNRFRRFSHGYVMTSHKSQSKTVDHVVVAASRLDAKAAYVACSRGKQSCTVHTPDKEELLRRLPIGERASALDVLKTEGTPHRNELSPSPDRIPHWSKLTRETIEVMVGSAQRTAAWLWMQGIRNISEIARCWQVDAPGRQVDRTPSGRTQEIP